MSWIVAFRLAVVCLFRVNSPGADLVKSFQYLYDRADRGNNLAQLSVATYWTSDWKGTDLFGAPITRSVAADRAKKATRLTPDCTVSSKVRNVRSIGNRFCVSRVVVCSWTRRAHGGTTQHLRLTILAQDDWISRHNQWRITSSSFMATHETIDGKASTDFEMRLKSKKMEATFQRIYDESDRAAVKENEHLNRDKAPDWVGIGQDGKRTTRSEMTRAQNTVGRLQVSRTRIENIAISENGWLVTVRHLVRLRPSAKAGASKARDGVVQRLDEWRWHGKKWLISRSKILDRKTVANP